MNSLPEDDDLLDLYMESCRDDLLAKAKKWRSRQPEYERNWQQDRNSKKPPRNEYDALWRIELAILRVARALEASNVG